MITHCFSYANGMTLLEKASRFHPEELSDEFDNKGICGLGMFNDQAQYRASRGLPLSLCYKYGGGEIGIASDGRVLFIEGHDEHASVKNMIRDLEDIFQMPIEKRVIGVAA